MKKTIIVLLVCFMLTGCVDFTSTNTTVCTFTKGTDSYEITMKDDGEKISKLDYTITSTSEQYKNLKEGDRKNFEKIMQKQIDGKEGIEIAVAGEEDALSITYKLEIQKLDAIPDVLLNTGKSVEEIKAMSAEDFRKILDHEGATCN